MWVTKKSGRKYNIRFSGLLFSFQIVLCFDFFLATHALTPIFLTSAVVLWRSNAVLNCSRDMASIHHLLNVMPNDIPVQALINDAQDLFRLFLHFSYIYIYTYTTYLLTSIHFSILVINYFFIIILEILFWRLFSI